jgi:hypothetical protein
VTGTLATAATDISAAVDELKQQDSKGELEQAFKDADSCSSLAGR